MMTCLRSTSASYTTCQETLSLRLAKMFSGTIVSGPVGTAIGVTAGDLIGDPDALGLDAVFPAFFLALLLGGAGLLWWLQRRYGNRLTAVEAPEDPFHRMPPHVWVYRELQRLLDRVGLDRAQPRAEA